MKGMYTSRIGTDPKNNISLAKEVINAYASKTISKGDKNTILRQIIESEMLRVGKILNVGFVQNRCLNCAGRGFIIIPEVVRERSECHGDPEHGILPCNGTGILTKVCQRCNGMTLIQLIEKERDHLEKIPSDEFIAEHGHQTFRIIEADEAGRSKYCYIPKKPCKACGGTGRFVYTNAERTKPCTCVKKRLVPTGKIARVAECSECGGDGRRIDNPVIQLESLDPKVRETLEKITSSR